MTNLLMSSPLEQFDVHTLVSFYTIGLGSYSFTNLSLYDLFGVVGLLTLFWLSDNNSSLVPNGYSLTFQSIYDTVFGIISEQLGYKDSLPTFPFVFALFTFILILNLHGNIPYSFAVTSSAAVAMGTSLTLWLGVTLIALAKHKIAFFGNFVPAGTPLALVPLMTGVETVSYTARAISLGIRLMANITAGHCLLAILAGFIYPLFTAGAVSFVLAFVPLLLFTLLIALELAVSFIQSFVFTILTASYIKDAEQLH